MSGTTDWKAVEKTHREKSRKAAERREESFRRCDTDGFVSQWASQKTSELENIRADIARMEGRHVFRGLYTAEGRRVKARTFDGKFGPSWILHDDEQEIISARGGKFIPDGPRSRVQKSLGLEEWFELAPARAVMRGNGTGLSGIAWASFFRSGDKWGQDATILPHPIGRWDEEAGR